MANGTRCKVTNSVRLHVKLSNFGCGKGLNIRGFLLEYFRLGLLCRTHMVLDVSSKRCCFRFALNCSGEFSCSMGNQKGGVLSSKSKARGFWVARKSGQWLFLLTFPRFFHWHWIRPTVFGTKLSCPTWPGAFVPEYLRPAKIDDLKNHFKWALRTGCGAPY